MGTPSQDTGLNSLAGTLDDDACLLLGWLPEAWEKQGLTPSELEVPELLWQKLKKDIERLREVDTLEGIHHIKPENAPADCVSMKTSRGLVRRDTAWLKSSGVAILREPRLRGGDSGTELIL